MRQQHALGYSAELDNAKFRPHISVQNCSHISSWSKASAPVRESAQSWRELLIDIKQRGFGIAADLAIGDSALGFWKAIEEAFPSARHQRCWVH
jgi:hypothetical protein